MYFSNRKNRIYAVYGVSQTPISDMIEREQIEIGKTLYMKYSIDERETFLPAVEEYFTDIEMIPYYAVIDNGKIVKTGQGYSEKSDYIDFIKENQNQ